MWLLLRLSSRARRTGILADGCCESLQPYRLAKEREKSIGLCREDSRFSSIDKRRSPNQILTRDPTAWSSWTWMDIASDSISALAREIPDAATYDAVTRIVFEDVINFGRLYAWHLFSRRIYARLSGTERTKMNATCYQTRWTLFKRCDYRIKCFLVILWLFE